MVLLSLAGLREEEGRHDSYHEKDKSFPRKKEGGGEEKGEEGGKEGEYWESCAEAARSLKTSLSRAKWLGRPSILPAGPDTSSVRHAV